MRFSALGENTAPAAEDIFPSTDISDGSKDKKVQFGTLAAFVREVNEAPESESFTYNGLTITAVRSGGGVGVRISGTLTADLDSSGGYVDICTVSANYSPYGVNPLSYATFNGYLDSGQVTITTAGRVRIGYTKNSTGSSMSIPSGRSVYAYISYPGRAYA